MCCSNTPFCWEDAKMVAMCSDFNATIGHGHSFSYITSTTTNLTQTHLLDLYIE